MRRGRHALIVGLLVVGTVLVYAEVGHHQYVNLDDDVYVLQNPWIRDGISWATVRWAFGTVHEAYWIPLTWLSLALDCRLFGLDAGAHLAENVALHALDAVLLYALLAGTTGAVGRSAFVATLFALHPMHVESVAWVSQRKDVLSTLCWMLATLAYVRYARRPSLGRYGLVLVPFALGLLAKPMLVTLPVTLLLLDVWPLARGARGLGRLVAEKLPLLAVAAAASAVTIWTQHGAGAVTALDERGPAARVATALVNYGLYLGKLAWPADLAVFYPLAPADAGLAASAALLVALASGVAVAAFRREPAVLIGWLWFLVTLLPVIGLVQVGGQQIADRYGYVPSIGIFIAVAWGAPVLAARMARAVAGEGAAWRAAPSAPAGASGAASSASAGGALAVAAVVVVIVAGVLARRQVGYWRDSVTLFERAVAVTRGNFLAHNNLGEALAAAGRKTEAAWHYAEAARIHPGYAPARNNHGIVLAEQGRLAEAEQEFRAALARNPGLAMAENNLATVHARRGDYATAAAHYERALVLTPGNALAHEGYADTLALQGRLEEAIVRYREALRWAPGSASARRSLARTLRRAGREAEAAAEERLAGSGGLSAGAGAE